MNCFLILLFNSINSLPPHKLLQPHQNLLYLLNGWPQLRLTGFGILIYHHFPKRFNFHLHNFKLLFGLIPITIQPTPVFNLLIMILNYLFINYKNLYRTHIKRPFHLFFIFHLPIIIPLQPSKILINYLSLPNHLVLNYAFKLMNLQLLQICSLMKSKQKWYFQLRK